MQITDRRGATTREGVPEDGFVEYGGIAEVVINSEIEKEGRHGRTPRGSDYPASLPRLSQRAFLESRRSAR